LQIPNRTDKSQTESVKPEQEEHKEFLKVFLSTLSYPFAIPNTNTMKKLGFILLIVGVLALLFDGINYSKKETLVEVGDMSISAKTQETLSWPGYTGAVLAAFGGVLILVGKRKK
jgi:hypothetical protein